MTHAQNEIAMKKILVTYATFSGSTEQVANVIAQELSQRGAHADVLPIDDVKNIEGYDGVVIGGPMIMGWHRGAMGFIKKHRTALAEIPFAVFITAISLTETGERIVDEVRVTVDDKLLKPPAQAGKLNFKERYARVSNYVRPILRATHPFKPARVGLFGGRLEYGRLKWWAVLFVMVIIQAPAGDRRNWDAIRAWAADLAEVFHLEMQAERAVSIS